MAIGVNKVMLIGNVGNIENKGNVTKASLATSESYKDKNTGEKVEKTEWHRLTFFGKLADIAAQYVGKGDKLYVEGAIKYGKYTGNDGIERYSTDIVVRNMQMLGSKGDKQADSRQSQGTKASPPEAATDDDFGDTIPF